MSFLSKADMSDNGSVKNHMILIANLAKIACTTNSIGHLLLQNSFRLYLKLMRACPKFGEILICEFLTLPKYSWP